MTSIIHFLFSTLFFFTPLLFTSVTSELFEVPKMYFVYLISLLILFFHLINWLKGKTPLLIKNKLTIVLLIFFSAQLFSTLFSVDLHTSIFGYYSRLNGGLLSLTSYLILFLILPTYLKTQFRDKIINLSLISGFLVSSFGILEHFGIDKNMWVQDVQSRVFSTLGQPNWLAAYLCVLLPLAIHKSINSKSKLLSTIYFLLTTNFYLCLLFTKSKSGILAAIISISLYFIFKLFQKTNFKVFIPILLILFSNSLIISNPIKNYLFPQKISSPIDQSSTQNITPSGDIRKIVWQGSLDLWKQFPVFGTGPETFAYSYYWTRPASHNLTSEWDFLYNKAHNEYLNYLATTGTLGFLTYIFFIFSVVFFLIKSTSPLNITILSSFISILITNFAGFSVVITSLFFFLLPVLVLPELDRESNNKPKPKIFYFLFIPLFLFLLSKILSFFLADIAYNQSQISSTRQKYDLAKDFIDTSISFRPKEAIYHSQASLIAAKLNQPSIAIDHSNIALSLSPSSTNLWKERAQVFSELSLQNPQYFNYAIDALEKCAILAPTDAKTFYLLGKFYEAASQTDLAIKNYQLALNLKANYDHASFALGQLYFDQKNYPEAQKYFEETLKITPINSEAKEYLKKIIF